MLLNILKIKRYEKIEKRPIFFIHEPHKIDLKKFKLKTSKILKKHDLNELYLVGNLNYIYNKKDIEIFDAVINWPPDSLFLGKFKNILRIFLPVSILSIDAVFKYCSIQDYEKYLNSLIEKSKFFQKI